MPREKKRKMKREGGMKTSLKELGEWRHFHGIKSIDGNYFAFFLLVISKKLTV